MERQDLSKDEARSGGHHQAGKPVGPGSSRQQARLGQKNKQPHSPKCEKHPLQEPDMGLKDQSMPRVGMGKAFSLKEKRRVAKSAKTHGIKPTARRFHISRNTVRCWLKSYQAHGIEGLRDKRKGPNQKPLKTPKYVENRVIAARKEAPSFGPRRLKHYYELPCSIGAIARIIRQNGLARPKRLKAKKRHDLREIKAKKYRGLEHLQMDLKHLNDMPVYVAQMKKLNLPRYQYTVRDTKSGMLWLGFSNELSELNARTMIDYVLASFTIACDGEQPTKTVQTDNGSEFSGGARWFETSSFSKGVSAHGPEHVYIRPGHKNAQADVESSHRLIEEEFYDLTMYKSREDFLDKAEAYRLFFNTHRINYSKHGKVPWQIVQGDWNESDIASKVCLLSVIDLDKIEGLISKKLRGQSIPVLTDLRLIA